MSLYNVRKSNGGGILAWLQLVLGVATLIAGVACGVAMILKMGSIKDGKQLADESAKSLRLTADGVQRLTPLMDQLSKTANGLSTTLTRLKETNARAADAMNSWQGVCGNVESFCASGAKTLASMESAFTNLPLVGKSIAGACKSLEDGLTGMKSNFESSAAVFKDLSTAMRGDVPVQLEKSASLLSSVAVAADAYKGDFGDVAKSLRAMSEKTGAVADGMNGMMALIVALSILAVAMGLSGIHNALATFGR